MLYEDAMFGLEWAQRDCPPRCVWIAALPYFLSQRPIGPINIVIKSLTVWWFYLQSLLYSHVIAASHIASVIEGMILHEVPRWRAPAR